MGHLLFITEKNSRSLGFKDQSELKKYSIIKTLESLNPRILILELLYQFILNKAVFFDFISDLSWCDAKNPGCLGLDPAGLFKRVNNV